MRATIYCASLKVKMDDELPTLKRCCFCIPLRPGLLVWAYIQVITAAFFAAFLAFVGITEVLENVKEVVIIWVGVVLCLIHLSFSIVFVIGAHKKDYKLLRVFYMFYGAIMTIEAMTFYVRVKIYHFDITYIMIYLLSFVLDAYLLLLVRSEVLKLKANRCDQFVVKNAADSHGQLKKTNDVSDVV